MNLATQLHTKSVFPLMLTQVPALRHGCDAHGELNSHLQHSPRGGAAVNA